MAVNQGRRKTGVPLDPQSLERLALHYVGRYATTRARLGAYLARKIRERGWQDGPAPEIDALAERMSVLGYVDDRAFAEARGAGLNRRGYGTRRVSDALKAAGIRADDAAPALEAADAASWDAALAFARRKRLGPFAREPALDEGQRRKHFAAFMRAGHSVEMTRILLRASPGEIPDAPI
jgi:regulatory protein